MKTRPFLNKQSRREDVYEYFKTELPQYPNQIVIFHIIRFSGL